MAELPKLADADYPKGHSAISTSPIRVLYLTSSWPLGGCFGGQIRALHVGRALKQVGDVRVVVVNSEVDNPSDARATEAEFTVLPPVRCAATPNRSWVDKAQWAARPRFMNIHGFTASEPDRARVSTYCADADLVWVLDARTPNLLQQWAWPHGHLDLGDIPSTYMRTLSQSAEHRGQRLKARLIQSLLRRRELSLLERFATVSVCSREDREYLGNSNQVHVIPNGFSRPETAPERRPARNHPRLGFIGLGTFEPNIDGMAWFLRTTWSKIRTRVPGVRLRIVGKGFEAAALETSPDVDVLGEIAQPAAEIATWTAMVIPVRLGAGTRIKVAEAFSRKCPVVSTSIGAFGYDVQDRTHLRLADTPTTFADACAEIILDPVEASTMAERAFDLYSRNWTWDAIAPKVWAAAEACLRGGR